MQHLVLDLDETLIHSEPLHRALSVPEFPEHYFENYIIYERPHLKEFMDWVSQRFTITIWTAASEAYAKFVVQEILLPKMRTPPVALFTAKQCRLSQNKTQILKNLDILFELAQSYPDELQNSPLVARAVDYHPKNTLLIDDNVHVLQQNGSVIHARPFDLREDKELLYILKKLKTL